VTKLFPAYRVLAFVVGALLLVGTCASLLKYLLTEGGDLQQLGEALTPVWLVHGWIYMVYVVVAFLLSRRAGWSLRFLVVMLLAGLVPVMIFWVEHRVVQRIRSEHSELVSG